MVVDMADYRAEYIDWVRALKFEVTPTFNAQFLWTAVLQFTLTSCYEIRTRNTPRLWPGLPRGVPVLIESS
jgi:hypothetical protein